MYKSTNLESLFSVYLENFIWTTLILVNRTLTEIRFAWKISAMEITARLNSVPVFSFLSFLVHNFKYKLFFDSKNYYETQSQCKPFSIVFYAEPLNSIL